MNLSKTCGKNTIETIAPNKFETSQKMFMEVDYESGNVRYLDKSVAPSDY